MACIPYDPDGDIGPAFSPTAGTRIIGECDLCGRKIWVGPRTLRQKEQGVAKACFICLIERGILRADSTLNSLENLEGG